MSEIAGRTPSLWRHPLRGKHHIAPDQQTTLCGRPVPGFWQTQDDASWMTPKWAEEDLCATCRRKS